MGKQRNDYKKGKLPQDCLELLESVGFEWVQGHSTRRPPENELWKTKFVELVDYLVEHGNCNVPSRQGSLGKWVCKQRESYKIGKLSQIQHRKEYLESIGFAWELKRDGRWLPDRPEPNLENVARIIKEERYTPVVRALQSYLDKSQ